MENVIVTGGAGFIGSHLCESLLSKYKVICIDDLSSGKRENIEDIDKNLEFIQHNVIEPLNFDIGEISYIFHLASRASPIDYGKFPVHTLRTNSEGTYNMLELARKKDAKFLFASTSEIYGNPLEHPQKETYFGNVNPIGVRACYDEGKRFGETITSTYVREYGLDARIVRIFNTYGPKMRPDDGRVVSNFIVQALRNEPLTVYGDGSQTRSFCYISDMVEGIKKALFTKNSRGKVINLGNPNEFTIIELAKIVKKLSNSGSEIVFRELPEDDPQRRKPDITLAIKLLNWRPMVDLKDGLRRTIEYFSTIL